MLYGQLIFQQTSLQPAYGQLNDPHVNATTKSLWCIVFGVMQAFVMWETPRILTTHLHVDKKFTCSVCFFLDCKIEITLRIICRNSFLPIQCSLDFVKLMT